MVRTGRVTSLADFGAFVNINGADGLVHLSEISWDHIDHPKEVLTVGEEVRVKIISIDRDRRRIGLSLRQLKDDPWDENIAEYQVGQLVEGKITRLTKFGAFAQIDDNLEGLVHISELSDRRIEHPKEVLSEEDIVTLRIIKIDTDRRRIGLSLRKVDSQQYSDMDWQMALSELDGISLAEEDEEDEAPQAEAAEAETAAEETEEVAAEAETVAEETEAVAAEAETVAEESEEVAAEADTTGEEAEEVVAEEEASTEAEVEEPVEEEVEETDEAEADEETEEEEEEEA